MIKCVNVGVVVKGLFVNTFFPLSFCTVYGKTTVVAVIALEGSRWGKNSAKSFAAFNSIH